MTRKRRAPAAPEPPPAARYRVVGGRTVRGVPPGGVLELPEDRARSLLRAGHIAPADDPPAPGRDTTPETRPGAGTTAETGTAAAGPDKEA